MSTDHLALVTLIERDTATVAAALGERDALGDRDVIGAWAAAAVLALVAEAVAAFVAEARSTRGIVGAQHPAPAAADGGVSAALVAALLSFDVAALSDLAPRVHRAHFDDRRAIDETDCRRPSAVFAEHRVPVRAFGVRAALPADLSLRHCAPITLARLPTAVADGVGLRDDAGPPSRIARAGQRAAAGVLAAFLAGAPLGPACVRGIARIPGVDVVGTTPSGRTPPSVAVTPAIRRRWRTPAGHRAGGRVDGSRRAAPRAVRALGRRFGVASATEDAHQPGPATAAIGRGVGVAGVAIACVGSGSSVGVGTGGEQSEEGKGDESHAPVTAQ